MWGSRGRPAGRPAALGSAGELTGSSVSVSCYGLARNVAALHRRSARWDHAVMGTEGALDLVRGGREALAAADWERARWFFEQARERDDSPEAIDGLSEVAHFS